MKILHKKSFHLIILSFLSLGFYFNTLFNQYALDDVVVITENRITKKGIDGIFELVSNDLMHGFLKNGEKTGLYRPLSLLTHALEYEFFGKDPFISHLINILLYTFLVLLLYHLLEEYFFKDQSPLIAFFSALIFAIHPIHTEAVANIKSRDELLSLMFLMISLILLFSFFRDQKKIYLFAGSLLAYTLALFSKESAITFLFIIPLALYFFSDSYDYNLRTAARHAAFFILPALLYVLVKYHVTGLSFNDHETILNTPYLYATAEQAFATKMYVMLKYICLLFFPHPLSYDYSYNQIPYINFSDPLFLIASAVITGLILLALLTLKKKNIFSFCILYYFAGISIVSNFIFKIGAPMGERFLFQPSVGFALAAGFLIYLFISHVNIMSAETRLTISFLFLSALTILAGYKTINRNQDWKNNRTLFLQDVKAAPNSIRTLTNAAIYSYNHELPEKKTLSEIKEAYRNIIARNEKAIRIDPLFTDPYVNLIFIYFQKKDLAGVESVLNLASENKIQTAKLEEAHKALSYEYVQKGHTWYQEQNKDSALVCFSKAAIIDPQNAEAHWNAGGLHLDLGNISQTISCWEKTLLLNPEYPKAKELLARVKRDFEGKY